MSRKSENYWKEHVRNLKESGLSPNAYCVNNNLIHSTLTRWMKKLDNNSKVIKVNLPVEPTAYNTRDEIIVEGKSFTIRIPDSVSPELLQVIIRELQ